MPKNLIRSIFLSTSLLFLLSILNSCANGPLTNSGNEPFKFQNIVQESVQIDTLDVYRERRVFFHPKDFDEDGIPLRKFDDKLIYHPSSICDLALNHMCEFKNDGDSNRLKTVDKYLTKLDEIAVNVDDAKYYPYDFSFVLHGWKDEKMVAPWFSSLGQGKVLSAQVRMYNLTKNDEYLSRAKQTFQSFTQYRDTNGLPWISYVDADSMLWLEEYPLDSACNTLNGMIVGIFGLYEYYHLTNSSEAQKLINGSLYTLKMRMEDFHNDRSLSYYCLKHKKQHKHYHSVHIRQMTKLYLITRDEFFKETALRLDREHKSIKKHKIHDLDELNIPAKPS